MYSDFTKLLHFKTLSACMHLEPWCFGRLDPEGVLSSLPTGKHKVNLMFLTSYLFERIKSYHYCKEVYIYIYTHIHTYTYTYARLCVYLLMYLYWNIKFFYHRL